MPILVVLDIPTHVVRTFELIALAKQLASETSVIVVVLEKCENLVIQNLAQHGADKIYIAPNLESNHPENVGHFITSVAKENQAHYILFSDNFSGKIYGTSVSVQLNFPMSCGIFAFENGKFKRECFSGKAIETFSFIEKKGILTVVSNAFVPVRNKGKRGDL